MGYYSVKEVAEMLSVNDETVRRWIRDDKLEAQRGSGRQGSKITSEALKNFLEQNKGLNTTLAATTLGLGAGATAGLASLAAIASPLSAVGIAGAIAGVSSWLSILKNKDKDKKTIKLELLEKAMELENLAMQLKNDIAIKQNELELVEKQLVKLNEITCNFDENS